jgi:hypothetical protein
LLALKTLSSSPPPPLSRDEEARDREEPAHARACQRPDHRAMTRIALSARYCPHITEPVPCTFTAVGLCRRPRARTAVQHGRGWLPPGQFWRHRQGIAGRAPVRGCPSQAPALRPPRYGQAPARRPPAELNALGGRRRGRDRWSHGCQWPGVVVLFTPTHPCSGSRQGASHGDMGLGTGAPSLRSC